MFQIRRLSGHDLRKAETADTKKKLQVAQDAGSALEILGELEDKVRTRVEAARVARGEPAEGRAKGAYESYDLETVIELGLIEWSGPNYDDLSLTLANRRTLDSATEDFLFEEIMKRSVLTPGEETSSSAEPTPPSSTAEESSPES